MSLFFGEINITCIGIYSNAWGELILSCGLQILVQFDWKAFQLSTNSHEM